MVLHFLIFLKSWQEKCIRRMTKNNKNNKNILPQTHKKHFTRHVRGLRSPATSECFFQFCMFILANGSKGYLQTTPFKIETTSRCLIFAKFEVCLTFFEKTNIQPWHYLKMLKHIILNHLPTSRQWQFHQHKHFSTWQWRIRRLHSTCEIEKTSRCDPSSQTWHLPKYPRHYLHT